MFHLSLKCLIESAGKWHKTTINWTKKRRTNAWFPSSPRDGGWDISWTAEHMFTQTAPFADRKIELEGSHLVWACTAQRGWGEGGTHVGRNRDESCPAFYKLGGILDKLRSFGTNPELIYVVLFFWEDRKLVSHGVARLNIPIRYRLQQSEAGSRHGEAARWGIAWRCEKKRCEIRLQQSDTKSWICRTGVRSVRWIDAERVKECEGTRQETGEARKRSYGKSLAVSKLKGFFSILINWNPIFVTLYANFPIWVCVWRDVFLVCHMAFRPQMAYAHICNISN